MPLTHESPTLCSWVERTVVIDCKIFRSTLQNLVPNAQNKSVISNYMSTMVFDFQCRELSLQSCQIRFFISTRCQDDFTRAPLDSLRENKTDAVCCSPILCISFCEDDGQFQNVKVVRSFFLLISREASRGYHWDLVPGGPSWQVNNLDPSGFLSIVRFSDLKDATSQEIFVLKSKFLSRSVLEVERF